MTFDVLCSLRQHGSDRRQEALCTQRDVCFILKLYLLVDGGTESKQQEPVGDNRENTQDGGEEDQQPNDGLAQGVSGGSWKHMDAVAKWHTVIVNYGVGIPNCTTIFSVVPCWCLSAHL